MKSALVPAASTRTLAGELQSRWQPGDRVLFAGAYFYDLPFYARLHVPVQVIDTVGAGDTFQAALITWLAEHHALKGAALPALTTAQLADALGFAARAAAITCSRRGADMPRRAEVT